MSTQLTSTELRLLVGMRRTGKITQTEFLQGIWLARNSESRSKAEKEAARWFSIQGSFTKYVREYQLAVGHLTKHRLQMDEASFSSLFVKMLMDACITVEEAEKVVAFISSDYRAGALELIRLFQEGRISRNEVHLAFTAAVTAKSQDEAERWAQLSLSRNRTAGVDGKVTLDFSFCAACLYMIGEWSGITARDKMIAEIKQAVYAAEDRRITTQAPAVNTFDPNIPRPMMVRTTTELLVLGRPDENGFRDVAMTPPNPGETVFPPRMAQIVGSTILAERGPIWGVQGSREIRIGCPMVLRPPQSPDGMELWATSPVVSVEVLWAL